MDYFIIIFDIEDLGNSNLRMAIKSTKFESKTFYIQKILVDIEKSIHSALLNRNIGIRPSDFGEGAG